jgi:uncharacterized membrane protein YoaK (UPF0700 family)
MPINTLQMLTSEHRTSRTNYQLGSYLAFIAGAINAGGFLAIGRYTSHMSGIISATGDDLALGNLITVLAGLALLASFIFGAATTAILVNWGQRRKIHSRYALPLLLEAFVLLLFGIVGANLSAYMQLTVPVIVFLLCYVMGLQNAIITKISKAEIRTTHMTGIVTDIGIELGKLFYWNRSEQGNEVHLVLYNKQKLKDYTLILSMFTAGGVIGAAAFKYVGFISVLPISASLIGVALVQVYRDLKVLFPKFAR